MVCPDVIFNAQAVQRSIFLHFSIKFKIPYKSRKSRNIDDVGVFLYFIKIRVRVPPNVIFDICQELYKPKNSNSSVLLEDLLLLASLLSF